MTDGVVMAHTSPMSDVPAAEIEKRYEVCGECADRRAAGEWPKNCWCNGTGMRRIPSTYQCNLCAGPLCPGEPDINSRFPLGIVETRVQGSYSSEHLTDMTTYELSLCEKCLRKLFTSCQIPPTTQGVHADDYADDLAAYEKRTLNERRDP